MGMGMMVCIGGHAIIKGSAAGADAIDQFMFHQKIQDAIDGDPVDTVCPIQGFENIGGGKGIAVVADDFEYTKPVVGCIQMSGTQQVSVIALIAHVSSSADLRRYFFPG